ncbi:uncharacterized protein LOC121143481 [Mesocricetus auratus]|uniref:Uncharacterized protein LOC121143481 n=1 Tax=Mesocricetus auratus TaxID=10036 RepID=A0ABM2Y8U9_MESAU|nr:uncharacterized protein LOC121143481 [Mesocricetus auratus]
MVTILLEYKADTSITNKDGVSPLILAQQGSNESLIKLLAGKDTVKRTEEAEEPERLTLEISDLEATTKCQAEECKNSLATKDGIIQSLTCSLEDGKKTISELEKEITRLKYDYSKLQATKKCQEEEGIKCQKTQNQLIQAWTMHFKNGKEEMNNLLKEIDRLKLKIYDLQVTTKRQAEEIKEIKINHEKTIQSLTWHLKNLNENISNLQEEIASPEHEYSDLQATTKCHAEENRKCQKNQNPHYFFTDDEFLQVNSSDAPSSVATGFSLQ